MRKDELYDKADKYLGIVIGVIGWMLAAWLIVGLLSGCTQYRYITVPEYHFVDSTEKVFVRDSVYLHDSIYTSLVSQNDTVFLTKYVTKYKYKERVRVDTLIAVRVDSVSVPTPIETKTEYEMPRWKQFFFHIGLYVSFALLCYIVYWLVRKWR